MKVLALSSPRQLSEVHVSIPQPGAGQIRIKVACVGVCGSDVEIFAGRRAAHNRYNCSVIGHELSGIVDAVGNGVYGIRIGDQATCIEGWGCLADYILTTPVNTLIFDDRISLVDGCLLEVLPGVAMAAWRTGITRQSHVLIVGQGLSGLLLTRLVHLHGCRHLTVVDPDARKLEISNEFGADTTVVGYIKDCLETLRTDFSDGFDVVIVATTESDIINTVVQLVSKRGRIVAYGGLSETAQLDVMAMHRRSVTLIKEGECVNGVIEARNIWHQALQLVYDGLLPLQRLRTHVYPMARAQNALELRNDPKQFAIHVVLQNEWSETSTGY